MTKKRFNLRNVIAIALCLTVSATIFAQETGVVINGVKWATRNLDVGGKFVTNEGGISILFQWGRPADGHESRTGGGSLTNGTTTILSTTDVPAHGKFITVSSSPYDWRIPQNDALWNTGTEDTPVKSANDPSPSGWRVPTHTEFKSLLDETKVSCEYVKEGGWFIGIRFTDITGTGTNGNSVFFPTTGYINCENGNFYGGNDGYYWSSTPSGTRAYILSCQSNDANWFTRDRANAHSIRPVADEGNVGINTISSDTENAVVIGYFDMLGRKLPEEPKQGLYIIRYSNGTAKKVMR